VLEGNVDDVRRMVRTVEILMRCASTMRRVWRSRAINTRFGLGSDI
jgi:hypothetical protein